VIAAGGTYAILMTSWIFSAHGVNFVKFTILLSKEQDALSDADDQIGGPTAAADIAATLRQMAVHLRLDNSCIVTPKHPSGYRVLGCTFDVRAER
jgi:dTDP-4-dehydrorhamnose reductase